MRVFADQMHLKKSTAVGKMSGRNAGNRRRMQGCRGSFTVESVFLFPIILLLIAFLLHLSADWFESVRQAAEDVDVLRQMNTRTYFLNQNTLQEILELLQ